MEVVECITDTMECSRQRCFCDWHVTYIQFWIIPLIISLDCLLSPDGWKQIHETGENPTKLISITKIMYLWWSLCTLYLDARQVSYRRRLRSLLLYLC